MNKEEKTAKTIVRLLNHSLHDIAPGTLYQLRAARRAALENYQPAEKILHTGAGALTQNGYHWFTNHTGKLMLAISFLLLPVVHHFWQINYKLENKSAPSHTLLSNDAPVQSFNTKDEDVADSEEETDDTADTPSDETASPATENTNDSASATDISDTDTDIDEVTNNGATAAPADSSEAQDPDWMDEPSDTVDNRNQETHTDADETGNLQDSEEINDAQDEDFPDTDSENGDIQETEGTDEISDQ